MVHLGFASVYSATLHFLIIEPFFIMVNHPMMGRPQVIDAVMKTGVRKYTLNEYLEASTRSDSPALRYPPEKRLCHYFFKISNTF